MGYTTEFSGAFAIVDINTGEQKRLQEAEINYLNEFARTRRVRRDAYSASQLKDPVRAQVKLPIGVDGGYYVGSVKDFYDDAGGPSYHDDESVVNGNAPPDGQPGLWCQWVPNRRGDGIEWDGAEKFYNYVEWLEYILANFLTRWGYGLAGSVRYRGEEFSDMGTITVVDKVKVTVTEGAFV